LAVIEGTLVDSASKEFSHAVVGVEKPATDLVLESGPCPIRKWRWLRISTLFNERPGLDLRVEVDAPAIQAWRRSCLETTDLKAQCPY
jgi:hypothetical protein